jgi:hypothetical protein
MALNIVLDYSLDNVEGIQEKAREVNSKKAYLMKDEAPR